MYFILNEMNYNKILNEFYNDINIIKIRIVNKIK